MTIAYADRVNEVFTTTGTGTISLGGAQAGYRTFYAGVGDGAIVSYCMDNASAGIAATAWEVGVGTLTHGTPDTLSRDILYASSTGSLISWAAGNKNVYCVLAAEDIARLGNSSPINSQVSSYTVAITDAGTLIRMSSVSSINLTIPPNSSVGFNIGTAIAIEQVGTGSVLLVPGAGVTFNRPPNTSLAISGQYARIILTKVATDTWDISNGLASTLPISQSATINTGTSDLPINYSAGTKVKVALTHNISTITFSNWPASGTEGSVRVWFTADGTLRTITWLINGATGKWPGGSAPTMSSTSGYVDGIDIISDDNLATIKMIVVGQAIH